MVFLNNMLMKSSPIVFDIPLQLSYDQCYPLHEKPQIFVLSFFWSLLIQ